MKRLMFAIMRGGDMRLRDDEPGTDGAPPASGETPPPDGNTPPPDGNTPPGGNKPPDGSTPPPDGNKPTDGGNTPPPDGGDPKPFLGESKPGGTPPAQATDDDYAKALQKDTALLGDDQRIQLDADLYKACVPVMRKYGVSPEAANALANALAKAQVDDAKARMQQRIDYFEKMKQESMRTYTPADFETINAGIDRWFKPGGVMNNVIRNSELGADPEFLALMHHLGKAVAQDDGAGAAGGGGGPSVDPNSEQGLSDLW